MTTLFFIALAFYAFCGYVTLGGPSSSEGANVDAESTERNLTLGRSIFGADSTRWAQYAPYFPVKPYVAPPEGCEVDQVGVCVILRSSNCEQILGFVSRKYAR